MNTPSRDGHTPLDWALVGKSVDCAELLVEAEGNVAPAPASHLLLTSLKAGGNSLCSPKL